MIIKEVKGHLLYFTIILLIDRKGYNYQASLKFCIFPAKSMDPIEDFIYSLEGNQRAICQFLHEMMLSHELGPKLRYKIPFYFGKSWICYLNPLKGDGIELAFPRGNELSNAQELLMDKGRKQVRGMDFFSIQDIPQDAVREILVEAIMLDESIPYASKRKKK